MRVPSLREVSIDAARFLASQRIPLLPRVSACSLIVGSGNAAATGRALFPFAIHATESSYADLLARVKRVVVISASGAKHAVVIARHAHSLAKPVVLITTRRDAPAAAFASRVIITPARDEPFSYNVSTYAGMLAMLREAHAWHDAIRFAQRLDAFSLPFRPRMLTLILPDDAEWLVPFLLTKGDELFAARLPLRVFTQSEVLHAKTIIPDARELFIVLSHTPPVLADRTVLRLSLPRASRAVRLLMAYALIGRVQELLPDWFGRYVEAYAVLQDRVFSKLYKRGEKGSKSA